jgi:DNA-binding NtrC family response regulator
VPEECRGVTRRSSAEVAEALQAAQGRDGVAWLITSTHNLADAVRFELFHADLYRQFVKVALRPLRERDDMLVSAEHFLTRVCSEYDLGPKRLTDEARASLLAYPWPGNLRQLAYVMERTALLCRRQEIDAADLGLEWWRPPEPDA